MNTHEKNLNDVQKALDNLVIQTITILLPNGTSYDVYITELDYKRNGELKFSFSVECPEELKEEIGVHVESCIRQQFQLPDYVETRFDKFLRVLINLVLFWKKK